jgi:hypothetical protein
MSTAAQRGATVEDVHAAALAMPHVTRTGSGPPKTVYQVGGKSFVIFRNPRPDAVDPETGERYDDVIVVWVPSEQDKEALLQAPDRPYFTTPHFAGHPSVLVRASRLHEAPVDEITELVQEAWLTRASRRRARAWLAGQGLPTDGLD